MHTVCLKHASLSTQPVTANPRFCSQGSGLAPGFSNQVSGMLAERPGRVGWYRRDLWLCERAAKCAVGDDEDVPLRHHARRRVSKIPVPDGAKASINTFGCAFAKGFAAPDTHDTPPNAACAAPKALPAAADGAFLLKVKRSNTHQAIC